METPREMMDKRLVEMEAINSEVLAALKDAPSSNNVMIAYRLDNGDIKIVDMGYATKSDGNKKLSKKDEDQQFGCGCMRVNGNLAPLAKGYVRTPKGVTFEVSRESRRAKLIK
jgi:hypothetical protein